MMIVVIRQSRIIVIIIFIIGVNYVEDWGVVQSISRYAQHSTQQCENASHRHTARFNMRITQPFIVIVFLM